MAPGDKQPLLSLSAAWRGAGGLTAVLLAGALRREVKRLSKDPAVWEGGSWRRSRCSGDTPESCWLLAQALSKPEKQFARA